MILFLFVLGIGFGQTNYWTVYNMKIKSGQETKVLASLDDFFNSDVGKSLPTAVINATMFSNSTEDYTHQVIFASPDKATFGKMYSGALNQNKDFQLLTNILDRNTESRGSYLGKSIDATPNTNAIFSTVIGISVSDPVTYLSEWRKLKSAVTTMWGGNVTFDFHQMLSGNEPGWTHVVVVSAPDFETLLDISDRIYSTPEFMTFAKNVSGIRKMMSNNTTVQLKTYNAPQ